MNAPANIEPPLDDIRTFLPGISEEEYEARAKLRSLRNAASAQLARAESTTAKQLAFVVIEYLAELLYAPLSPAALSELRQFCTRLMLVSCQAENIEVAGLGAVPMTGGHR